MLQRATQKLSHKTLPQPMLDIIFNLFEHKEDSLATSEFLNVLRRREGHSLDHGNTNPSSGSGGFFSCVSECMTK